MPGFKVFIPSYGRAATIRTHLFLKGVFDYRVVVHNEEEAVWYRRNSTLEPKRIVVSGMPLGIAGQRNWILENLTKDGDWFGMFDDNIAGFIGPRGPLSEEETPPVHLFGSRFWRKKFRAPLTPSDLEIAVRSSIARAQEQGAHLIGFATTDNYFFRKKKWQEYGYVSTKAAFIQRTSLRFDPFFKAKDDHDFTAQNLQTFGKVLINNFVFPLAGHFEPGGIGNKQTRLNLCLKECARLMEKYPELWRYNNAKKVMAKNSEVVLRAARKKTFSQAQK